MLARYQPVPMFDAVGIHLADEVMQELAAATIWFSVIPARLTWLLQPLDTHGFAKYKRYLKRLFQDNVTGITAANCAERMVLFVVDAIRVVLQGNRWEASFDHNGLAGDQRNVSKYIKQNLELEVLPLCPPQRPTPDVLRLCWPRNRTIRPDVVYTALPPADPPVAVVALEDQPPAILLPIPGVALLALPNVISGIVPVPHAAAGAASSSAIPRAADHVEDSDATSSLEALP